MEVGDIITLPKKKRDFNFDQIGGLKVQIISIEGRHSQIATVQILATGKITEIII